LHWAEQFYESSALPDLLSVPAEKVNEDACTGRWMPLLPHKPALEKHLKEKLESCSNWTTICCCMT